MVSKKRVPIAISFAILIIGTINLLIQLNKAHQEYTHWRSREKVLVKELQNLREETADHQEFLDQLRRNPDFQDEVARKELGYGSKEEWLYRFPND